MIIKMARKTIRDKLKILKRRFPFRTAYAFLFAKKGDRLRKYSTILVYSLIYSPEKGHSLFIWNPHRKGKDWNSKEWNTWLNREGLAILSDAVMLAINNKRGDHWEFQRLVGFSGDDYQPRILHVAQEGERALYPSKNKRKRKGRNKTHAKRK
jgi:hypothetical protein